jgi:hypothetical protein
MLQLQQVIEIFSFDSQLKINLPVTTDRIAFEITVSGFRRNACQMPCFYCNSSVAVRFDSRTEFDTLTFA